VNGTTKTRRLTKNTKKNFLYKESFVIFVSLRAFVVPAVARRLSTYAA